jgi:hypothetical protein
MGAACSPPAERRRSAVPGFGQGHRKTLDEMKLPANETGVPMTYLAHGKQYIMVAIGNRDFPAELVALTLP